MRQRGGDRSSFRLAGPGRASFVRRSCSGAVNLAIARMHYRPHGDAGPNLLGNSMMKRRIQSLAGTGIALMSRISTRGRRAIAVSATLLLVPLGVTLGVTSSAQAAVTCHGTTFYGSVNGTVREQGLYWHNGDRQVCVGQADLVETAGVTTGLLERVRVWNPAGDLIWQQYSSGTIHANYVTFETDVDQLFNYGRVHVCVAVVFQSNGHQVDGLPAVCQWLPT